MIRAPRRSVRRLGRDPLHDWRARDRWLGAVRERQIVKSSSVPCPPKGYAETADCCVSPAKAETERWISACQLQLVTLLALKRRVSAPVELRDLPFEDRHTCPESLTEL